MVLDEALDEALERLEVDVAAGADQADLAVVHPAALVVIRGHESDGTRPLAETQKYFLSQFVRFRTKRTR